MDGGQAMALGASTLKAKLLLAFCQFFDDRTWQFCQGDHFASFFHVFLRK
jgi:hypothetical protein